MVADKNLSSDTSESIFLTNIKRVWYLLQFPEVSRKYSANTKLNLIGQSLVWYTLIIMTFGSCMEKVSHLHNMYLCKCWSFALNWGSTVKSALHRFECPLPSSAWMTALWILCPFFSFKSVGYPVTAGFFILMTLIVTA